MKFDKLYFLYFILLLFIEIAIAIWANDSWIRPYFGDFLVVILLYCLVKSFVRVSSNNLLLSVLLFSYTVEFLQFLDFVNIIGVQNWALARTLMGTSFSWIDLLMYTLGILFVYLAEYKFGLKKRAHN